MSHKTESYRQKVTEDKIVFFGPDFPEMIIFVRRQKSGIFEWKISIFIKTS